MEYDPKKHGLYERFRRLMIDLVNNGTTKLSRDELLDIFEWCVGGMPQSPNKFTSLLKHHRIHMSNVWIGGRTVRGIDVSWVSDPQWLAGVQNEIIANAI